MDDLNHSQNGPESLALVKLPSTPESVRRLAYNSNPYGFERAEIDHSSVGLLEYWAILRRNKTKILLAAATGLVAGLLIGIPMKSIYRARTSIEVLSMNEDFMNMKQANPVGVGLDSDVSEEQTQLQILGSETMLERVISRLDPNPTHTDASPIAVFLHLAPTTAASHRTAAILKAATTLKVSAKPHTRILEATVDSADRDLAVNFLNTLDQEFVLQSQEARLATTQHTGDWLSHELNDAREKLRSSEDALQSYARTSGIILADDSTNVATEKLQQFQGSLSAATADRIAKQSRYELAKTNAPESLGDVLNDPSLRDTQGKINDLKRQIADLTAVYNSGYNKIGRLQAELQTLQTAFSRQRADIIAHIYTDYQESVRKERLLANAYSDQTHEVIGQGEKAIQYNILKREVDSNRLLYDSMLQQTKQASIANAMRASNIRILDPARRPTNPIFPNFKMNGLIGMMGGLFLSACVILVRAQMDRTLQQPGEIKQWIELPELGVIPNALIANRAYYRRSSKSGTSAPSLALPDGSPGNVIELATWQKTPGSLAEAFRFALTSILFVGKHRSSSRVLVVTSANSSEGKTTTVSNLAIAASEIRLKVLVIDADLRRPRMHELFNLSNKEGLSDFLRDEMTEDSMAALIQSTMIPNLDVLTAGPETENPAYLLYSPNFEAFLQQFRKEYDIILIDTPPMLQMTDARIIGRNSDAVVLVARAGQTSRDALQAAKQRFDEDGIQIVGSILNDWNPRTPTANHYGDKPPKQ